MTENLAIVLREMTPNDRNFVLSSWLRSYADEQKGMARVCFFRLYEPIVRAMVDRCTVMVAGLPEVEDAVLGWMAADVNALHYVFVKPRWRKLGVAKRLLDGAETMQIVYSHEPPRWARVPPSWRYDPLTRFGDSE